MSTEKQIAANRRNAEKSTGPRTPDGRAKSRMNALQHGLTSTAAVINGESQQDYQEILQGFVEGNAPQTFQEMALITQIANHYWRLQRCRQTEQGAWNLKIKIQRMMQADRATYDRRPAENQEEMLYMTHRDNHSDFELMARYEGRIERSYYKALDALAKLQKTRPIGAIGFVSQNNSQQSEETEEQIAAPQETHRAATASTESQPEIGFVCSESPATHAPAHKSEPAAAAETPNLVVTAATQPIPSEMQTSVLPRQRY